MKTIEKTGIRKARTEVEIKKEFSKEINRELLFQNEFNTFNKNLGVILGLLRVDHEIALKIITDMKKEIINKATDEFMDITLLQKQGIQSFDAYIKLNKVIKPFYDKALNTMVKAQYDQEKATETNDKRLAKIDNKNKLEQSIKERKS